MYFDAQIVPELACLIPFNLDFVSIWCLLRILWTCTLLSEPEYLLICRKEVMMPTEHCFENLKIKNNNLQHVASSRSSAMLVPIPNLQPSFCLVWCLWHYHDSMTSRENTWTCNTSRDKCTCPWRVSLSVTAVCAEGAVWWSWGIGKAPLHSSQWTERGQAEHPHLFPGVSCAFPSSHFPLYSMCCLISLQWNIREGCGLWAPGSWADREEPSVLSSLLDRFLEQEWGDRAPSLGHFR